MINWWLIIFIFLSAVLLSTVLTALVIYLAKKINLVDKAGSLERKIHQGNIPLGGGLAIFLSWLLVVFCLWQFGLIPDARFNVNLLFWLFISGLVLMFNGLLDDKYAWSAKLTIWGPLLAIVIIMLAGLKINYITNPWGGIFYLNNWGTMFSLILTFLWLLGTTYTTKLLDGLDGLAASISLVASLAIFAVSLSWDVQNATTSWLAIILAGSILGFLFWNWQPAKVFLGEGGSTWLGFMLGVLAIISGSKIATALLVMGLPVLDIMIVIIRRWRKKQAIWQGDKEHLHFRLLAAGLSQRQAVLFFCAISLLFAWAAVFFFTKIKIIILFLLVIFVLYFSHRLDKIIKNKHHEI